MRLALALSVPALLAAAAAAPAGCLPGDTRPEPATVVLTVESSPAGVGGVTTADGWSLVFDRVLAAIGDAALDNDSCNAYGNAGYDRVFSGTVGGAQKLSTVYGLGTCALRLRLRSPSSSALVTDGVSPSDVAALRAPGTDPWVAKATPPSSHNGRMSSGPPENGTALLVVGHASKDGVTKRFTWSFRGSVTLRACGDAGNDGGVTTDLDLKGGDLIDIPITLAAEELFRLAEGAGGLLFEPFAAADANHDGAITLDELAAVPAPSGNLGGPEDAGSLDAGAFDAGAHDGGAPDAGEHNAGDADAGDAGAWVTSPTAATLADLVYLTLAPQTVLVRGASCQVSRGGRGGGG
jgi:hypothetical protein